MAKKQSTLPGRLLRGFVTLLFSLGAAYLVGQMLLWGLTHVGTPSNTAHSGGQQLGIMDRFDMHTTNQISSALEGVLSVEKVYWLRDEDLIAPEPDQNNYATTQDPSTMGEFLASAAQLLAGQDTLFQTDTKLYAGSQVTYYLDETIMVITWKELINGTVYTLSEVKIAHPSQFRRFLADGVYGSDKQYMTTQMATTVNAVTASSGDFYKFRPYGIKVYQGEVMHVYSVVDTCFITDDGDMLFSYRGQINDKETAQKFVDDNNVRFSLAFGPVLVDNSECVPVPSNYTLGEVKDHYPRAAICKMGELHYLMVAANQDPDRGYERVPTMSEFGQQLQAFGAEKAYALDGGQTAVIVTNDQLMNRPSYGHQRLISDIIYFATAVPDGG